MKIVLSWSILLLVFVGITKSQEEKAEEVIIKRANIENTITISDYIKKKDIATKTGIKRVRKKSKKKKKKVRVVKLKKFDLNSATEKDLIKIKGIGPVLAKRILLFIDSKNSNISKVSELIKVKGLGKKKLEVISSYVYIKK